MRASLFVCARACIIYELACAHLCVSVLGKVRACVRAFVREIDSWIKGLGLGFLGWLVKTHSSFHANSHTIYTDNNNISR